MDKYPSKAAHIKTEHHPDDHYHASKDATIGLGRRSAFPEKYVPVRRAPGEFLQGTLGMSRQHPANTRINEGALHFLSLMFMRPEMGHTRTIAADGLRYIPTVAMLNHLLWFFK
jgi:hypothetical protein